MVSCLHIAEADPFNGHLTEMPPNGRATERSLAFARMRVGEVVGLLQRCYFNKQHDGSTIKIKLVLGQGLMGLADPKAVRKGLGVRFPDDVDRSRLEVRLCVCNS
jgi:hypothetical protein